MHRHHHPSQPAITPSWRPHHARHLRKLVLCIDDEASELAIRRLLLEEAGYDVLTCADSDTGLRLFSTEPVHLVVIDYGMPGLNGTDVAIAMRLIKPDVPIIMLSGYVHPPEDAQDVVDKYVVKGENPNVLLDNIRQLVR